ncbi:MAG: hypothetical protein V7731_16205 [Amphritea sp.]
MKALYTAVIAATLSTTATADILSAHCPAGCPTSPAGNDLVFGHVYALSNNPDTKFADWVAYEDHQVPSGYFKAVYDAKGNAAGFVMLQSADRNDDYCSKKESLTDIQALIAFDLPALTLSNAIYQRLGCN